MKIMTAIELKTMSDEKNSIESVLSKMEYAAQRGSYFIRIYSNKISDDVGAKLRSMGYRMNTVGNMTTIFWHD